MSDATGMEMKRLELAVQSHLTAITTVHQCVHSRSASRFLFNSPFPFAFRVLCLRYKAPPPENFNSDDNSEENLKA